MQIQYITKNFYDGNKKQFILSGDDFYEADDSAKSFIGKLIGSLPPREIIQRLEKSGAEFLKNDNGNALDEVFVDENNADFSNVNKNPKVYEKLIVHDSSSGRYYITAKISEIKKIEA